MTPADPLALPSLIAFVKEQGMSADMTGAFYLLHDEPVKAAKAEADAVRFAAITAILRTHAELGQAQKVILEGFDKRVFVRNIRDEDAKAPTALPEAPAHTEGAE